jgi:hypothetical protein
MDGCPKRIEGWQSEELRYARYDRSFYLSFVGLFYTFVHMPTSKAALKPKTPKQLAFFKRATSEYGGELLKTRAGRAHARPLDSKNTMHLVLRSSRAKGEMSFRRPQHQRAIQGIIRKFSAKYGVKVLSLANVGNHLHIHLKLSTRYGYTPFIRAVTSAIAMAVTGRSRWSKTPKKKEKFWDLRPFTRIVVGLRAYFTLRDYVELNQFEGAGVPREHALMIMSERRQSG